MALRRAFASARDAAQEQLVDAVDYEAQKEAFVAGYEAHEQAAKVNKRQRVASGDVDPIPSLNQLIDPAADLPNHCVILHDGQVYDVLMVKMDLVHYSDAYYILQLIHDPLASIFYVYTRFGRVGTAGAMQKTAYPALQEARDSFAEKFHSNSGLLWDDPASHQSPAPSSENHRVVLIDYAAKASKAQENPAAWGYWTESSPAGKRTGWQSFDAASAETLELLRDEFLTNPWLEQRVAAMGAWTYLIDLANMTQVNVSMKGRSVRYIQRFSNGALDQNAAAPKQDVGPTEQTANLPAESNSALLNPAASQLVASQMAPYTERPLTYEPDPFFLREIASAAGAVVYGDYDAVLNQNGNGHNNSKFYRIQILNRAHKFWVWTRWGREGEDGKGQLSPRNATFDDVNIAVGEFEKRFRDRTGNAWSDRAHFVLKPKKYDLLRANMIQQPLDSLENAALAQPQQRLIQMLPPTLSADLITFLDLVFADETFEEAMQKFEIDLYRLPLEMLEPGKIQHARSILVEIEKVLEGMAQGDLELLSLQFFDLLPQLPSRLPTSITSTDQIQKLFEMCSVLDDIAKSRGMVRESLALDGDLSGTINTHPLDAKYASLNAELKLLDMNSQEYQTIANYFEATKASPEFRLMEVFAVERAGEQARYHTNHGQLGNRRLLWHGANIASAAATLRYGLRIDPNCVGRAGKGIYLSCENSKSAQKVSTCARRGNLGVMFLAEAALGTEFQIQTDNPHLVVAPPNSNSVVAKGVQEPPVTSDAIIALDGNMVTVSQAPPEPNPPFANSAFLQTEFLIYEESQACLRYVATIGFP